MSAADDMGRMSNRLREIAGKLQAEDTPEESADELAREAADLVTRASNELDRALSDVEAAE